MRKKFALLPGLMAHFGPLWAPADGAGAGAAADAGAGDAAAAAAAAAAGVGEAAGAAAAPGQAAAPWYQTDIITSEERDWLTAKGLALDDPQAVLPKLVRGHRSAEQFMGKGVDKLLERPTEGQDWADWAAKNRTALGLPDKEDGYSVEPPDFWPKDAAWDADLEANARKLAFENGVPPAVHQKYVGLFAQKMKALDDAAKSGYTAANDKMMTDLSRDFGAEMPAVLNRARQAASFVAEQAGVSAEGMQAFIQTLTDKAGGDAIAVKVMAKIGELMGEDTAVGLGRGAGAMMTPAEASAEFARFTAADGEWAKAAASGDSGKIAELRPTFERLAKLAAAARKG